MNDELRFEHLCQAQIEGQATQAERGELAAILAQNEAALRAYLDQMRIHSMLAWQHGRSQMAQEPAPIQAQVPAPVRSILRPVLPRAWAAMAAALAICAAVAAMWQIWRSRTGAEFEVLAATDVSFHTGDRLHSRRVELDRGSLIIRLSSGATVEMAGPAAMELLSPMHVRLLHGNVTADVGNRAKGFVVETKDARVVDLGTRFGVSSDPAKSTDVAVFEGEVEVYQPTPTQRQQPEATLAAGDAVRIGTERRLTRLKMIALRPGAQSLDSQRAPGVVSEVTDNVADSTFRGYYGLVRNGMGEGARVYTTGHTRTWHAMPGGTFPPDLIGADAICTFDSDRYQNDLRITLQITRPCDLYVMTDSRSPAPDWIRAEFTDTGHRLQAGPWIPRGTPASDTERYFKDARAYVPYVVWRRHIDQPGAVTLGSPRNGEARPVPVMFSLAVKER